ncbi:hypothetical protein CL648_04475 [bacterium]|nr:hypothetical protein [bacterium]|tara:strand:- start:615 stop:2081 length:1467 start_codon:yes stop_codon:yes gene_type:complete
MIYPKRWSWVLLFGLMASILVLLYTSFLDRYPGVVIDEPWYANTAFNLAMHGSIYNDLFGFRGGDLLFGYPWLMSVWMKIVGVSFFKLRFLSVCLGVLGLGVFLRCLWQVNIRHSIGLIFGASLFIANNNFFIIFRRIRPESMTIVCVFAMLYFYMNWLNNRQNTGALIGCGAMAMVGFWCHPTMLVPGVVLGSLIVWDQVKARAWLPGIYYVLGNASVFVIFLMAFMGLSDANFWDFLVKESESGRLAGGWWGWSGQLKQFVFDYSLGVKRLYCLLFESLVFLLPWVVTPHRLDLKRLSIMGIGTLVGLFVVFDPFFKMHFSYSVSLALVLYMGVFADTSGCKHRFILGIGILYLLNNVAGNGYVLFQNRGNESIALVQKKIELVLGDSLANKRIIGTPYFWFFNPNQYGHIDRWLSGDSDGVYPDLVIDFPMVLSPTTGVRRMGVAQDYNLDAAHDRWAMLQTRLPEYQSNSIQTQAYGRIRVIGP